MSCICLIKQELVFRNLHEVNQRHHFVVCLLDLLLHLLICGVILTTNSFGENAEILLHGAQRFPSSEFLQDSEIHSAV
jgi:hypothetical protein